MSDAAIQFSTSPVRTESIFVTAPDGLKLHARCYGSSIAPGLPVVCLPGLARNEADFETLAMHLAGDPTHPRRVVALDYRGRGRSQYDRNWRNYSLPTELSDVIAVLTALGFHRAVFVGTSRGGLLTMLLAAARPGMLAGALLNDIGPVIEPQGLMRIKGYVGKLPRAKDFAEGAIVLRRLFSTQFPKLTEADWLTWAERNWEQKARGLAPRYDPRLAHTLKGIGPDKPLPALWAQFGALAHVPVMVVRGANSDILSVETVKAMRARFPDLDAIEIPDQGHAPLLSEPDILARISSFISRCETM